MKKLLSIILAITVAFGASSLAFAEEAVVKSIDWINFLGDDYSFVYGKKALVEGENAISVSDSSAVKLETDEETGDITAPFYSIYYDFEAEESGFYYIETEKTAFAVAKSFDGSKAEGCCESVNYFEESRKLVYIEKGKTVIGVFLIISDVSDAWDTVSIEYLGAEMNDYDIDEDAFDDFIIGWNVWEDASGDFGMNADCVLRFSSGKTFEMNGAYFPGTCSPVAKEGKNKAKIEFFGLEKEIEFTAFYLENLIESVELSNLEKHTVFSIDYTGSRRYVDASGETLTVKYTDGTEYSSVITDSMAEIVLSNGLVVPAYTGLSENYDDGTYEFVITVAHMNCAEYTVSEKENSFFENAGVLTDDNFSALYRTGDDLVTGIWWLTKDPEFSLVCFKQIFADLSQIITNFVAFAKYCTAN